MSEANQYFVARMTSQEGPYQLDELIRRIDAGRYTATDLCWSKADGEWMQLQERSEVTAALAAFDREQELLAERDSAGASDHTESRTGKPRDDTDDEPEYEPQHQAAPHELPAGLRQLSPEQIQLALRASIAWRRFIARIVDMNCAGLVFLAVLAVFAPQLVREQSLPTLVFYVSIAWPWLEGLLLGTLGWTPGKRLLALRVVRLDGARLDTTLGIQRSLSVWVFGLGMELPIINVLAMMWGFKSYAQHGVNIWDRQAGTRIEALPLPRARAAIATGLMFFLAIIAIAMAMAQIQRAP